MLENEDDLIAPEEGLIPFDDHEEKIALDTLERYSGCDANMYQPYLLLTNFPRYVQYFAQKRNVPIYEGSMFKVAHSPEEGVSILDFKIGQGVIIYIIFGRLGYTFLIYVEIIQILLNFIYILYIDNYILCVVLM